MAEVMFCGKTVCIIWHCMIATVDSKFLISLKHSVVFKKKKKLNIEARSAGMPKIPVHTLAQKMLVVTVLHWGKTVNCANKL